MNERFENELNESDHQIERILSKNWKNPFEVLQLKFNSDNETVKN